MVFRIVARNALPSARRAAARTPRAVVRRHMSSEHSHGSTGSDTPWIIGSALVFGPMIAYLLLPSKKEHEHGQAHPQEKARRGAGSGTHIPPEPEIVTDSEGKTEDVSGSISQALESGSPKEAVGAEAEDASAKSNASALESDTTSAPASEPDLQVEEKRGTFQEKGEKGPTDMGTARAAARETAAEGGTEAQAPKKAKEEEKPSSQDEKAEASGDAKSE